MSSSARAEVAAWRVLYAPEPLATKLGIVLDELEAAEHDREQLVRELHAAEESEQRYWAELAVARKREQRAVDALAFYADPETYFAIGIVPDEPAGEFMDDFSEVPWPDGGTNWKPGKRARAALVDEPAAAIPNVAPGLDSPSQEDAAGLTAAGPGAATAAELDRELDAMSARHREVKEKLRAELAVAREREQRAVDALRELVEAEDEVRRASDALTDEDDNAAMMARLATPTSRLTKAWRIARAALVDEPAAASEPDPATLSVTQGGIGDTAGFFLPPAAATLAEPEVSSDAE